MPQIETTYYKARKRFGQNFLRDHGVIDKIVASINPKQSEHLVEIGPGYGALTADVLECAGQLDVVELDKNLITPLLLRFGLHPNFTIHQADALNFDFARLQKDDRPLRIIGNLPYNISTALIFHLLKFAMITQDMHFMLQKEVVQRLSAAPGEKHYGRLGIMVQYYCQVDYLFTVGPESFEPTPKVDSAIVRIVPYKNLPYPCKDMRKLEQIVRDSFSKRRKTIRNTLKHHLDSDELEKIEINPSVRAEMLTLADFVRISDYLSSHHTHDF